MTASPQRTAARPAPGVPVGATGWAATGLLGVPAGAARPALTPPALTPPAGPGPDRPGSPSTLLTRTPPGGVPRSGAHRDRTPEPGGRPAGAGLGPDWLDVPRELPRDASGEPTSRRVKRMWARGSTPSTQVLVLAGRSLRGLTDPRVIVVGLLQPLVMLFLFSQVFSRVAQGPGFPLAGSYLAYLMPAVLVTTAAGSALGSGGWLVFERNSGVFTRLRAMPIRISSILLARSLSDLVRTALQLLLMIVLAMVVLDYRPAGGATSLLAAWVLAMCAGTGFSWLFLAISCWVRNVEVMQALGFLVMFPMTFASSAYVPPDSLPRYLRLVAEINPITYAVNGARAVTAAAPALDDILKALAISLLFTVAGMAVAVRGFRRSS